MYFVAFLGSPVSSQDKSMCDLYFMGFHSGPRGASCFMPPPHLHDAVEERGCGPCYLCIGSRPSGKTRVPCLEKNQKSSIASKASIQESSPHPRHAWSLTTRSRCCRGHRISTSATNATESAEEVRRRSGMEPPDPSDGGGLLDLFFSLFTVSSTNRVKGERRLHVS